jgi:PleD family two-component response regulator
MPLFRNKRTQAQSAAEPILPPGPELLRDRSLLVQWYIRHRLDEEMARAARYGYPLTLAILEPNLPAGHASPAAFVAVGARTAHTVARHTDLIGWLDDECILIILPHSDAVSAAAQLRDGARR